MDKNASCTGRTADEPLLTVAMSMRNAQATIALSVQSLLDQTFRDWELILVDDGSQDASVEIVRGFADSRIRLMVEPESRGLPTRLNQAIDAARGRYFARMDADDVCYPERFARQIAFLEVNPEVDLLGAAAVVFADGGVAKGKLPLRLSHDEICSRPLSGFYLPHPTWLGRTVWFRRYRYDVVATKSQDQDLLLRSYEDSRFACLPDILLGYRQNGVSLRNVLVSRWHYSAALLRHGHRTGRMGRVHLAVLEQIAKGLFDSLAVGAGLTRLLLGHRAQSITSAEAEMWRIVWNSLNGRMPQDSLFSRGMVRNEKNG